MLSFVEQRVKSMCLSSWFAIVFTRVKIMGKILPFHSLAQIFQSNKTV